MKICIVDAWQADFKVTFVDEWQADQLVAIVDAWRADAKVAVVDAWQADMKVAVVDEWRVGGGSSPTVGGVGSTGASSRRRSVDQVVPAIGVLAPGPWLAISFGTWCAIGLPLVALDAMPAAAPPVIGVIAILTPPLIALGSWLRQRHKNG